MELITGGLLQKKRDQGADRAVDRCRLSGRRGEQAGVAGGRGDERQQIFVLYKAVGDQVRQKMQNGIGKIPALRTVTEMQPVAVDEQHVARHETIVPFVDAINGGAAAQENELQLVVPVGRHHAAGIVPQLSLHRAQGKFRGIIPEIFSQFLVQGLHIVTSPA